MLFVLAFEVFCFGIFAFAVYVFGTARIADHGTESVYKCVKMMLDFISNAKDKRVRILAINCGVHTTTTSGCRHQIADYIRETEKGKGYQGLNDISYADMRSNCQFIRSIFQRINE